MAAQAAMTAAEQALRTAETRTLTAPRSRFVLLGRLRRQQTSSETVKAPRHRRASARRRRVI